MSQLSEVRTSIREELGSYPRRDLTEVKRRWMLMGLFGGHRAYLGHDLVSTLMAITFGGLGIWWLLDRKNLESLTEEWNADQARRETEGLSPKDVDGLLMADPSDLEVIPEWINDAKDADEERIEAIKAAQDAAADAARAGSQQLMDAAEEKMDAMMEKVPMPEAQRQMMAKQAEIQKKIMEKQDVLQQFLMTYSDQLQMALLVGIAAYGAAIFGAVEVGLLLIGLCCALTFTDQFLARSDTRLGRALLEWDYLLCSYYHENKQPIFIVAWMRSGITFIPRLLGFGEVGEQSLFNRLSGAAAAVCFILIPIDLVLVAMGDEPFEIASFFGGAVVGLIASVAVLAMFVPVIGGTLSRHKILGEDMELKVGGIAGAATATVGTVLGMAGIGYDALIAAFAGA